MPPFTVRWLEIADQHYADLPPDTQREIDARVTELCEHPEGPPEAYDPLTDQWTTTYGDGAGLIAYAVVAEQRRVLILRLV